MVIPKLIVGISKAEILKGKYKHKPEFQGGWRGERGGADQSKTLHTGREICFLEIYIIHAQGSKDAKLKD